jgi:hypothetical protein
MVRPLVLGYVRIRIGAVPGTVERSRLILVEFAVREGFTLEEIFMDEDENRSCAGLAGVIEAARRRRPVAVLVPHLGHLGLDARVQETMRSRMERESGVRVLPVSSYCG